MRATGINHVSISAPDLEASVRFYTEVFGMERIPAPRFPGQMRDDCTFMGGIFELPGGEAQMYLRDPAGNLVEIDWPDASALDRDVVADIVRLSDLTSQDDEGRAARLYRRREGIARETES